MTINNKLKIVNLFIFIFISIECSASDVIHLFNLNRMTDPAEIPGLKQAILNGTEAAGHTGTDGMLFLIDIGLKEF